LVVGLTSPERDAREAISQSRRTETGFRKLIYQNGVVLTLMPSRNEPLVSVITPTLNMGKYLEQAIISLENQSYKNIEHIVIDGGSSDDTEQILKRHESKYNLKWISEPDRSAADATNKGLKLAKGDIQHLLPADDLCLPWAIQTAVNAFDEHGDAEIIYGDCVEAPINGKYGQLYFNPPAELLKEQFAFGFADLPVFMRESVSRTLGGYDETWDIIAGFDLFARALYNFKWVKVEEALGFWRYRVGSISLGEKVPRVAVNYKATHFPESVRFRNEVIHGLGRGRMETGQLLRLLNATIRPRDGMCPWANLVRSGSVEPQLVMREAMVTYTPYLGDLCHRIGIYLGEGYIKAKELATTILKTTELEAVIVSRR
jgi:glycosyltransferase involved in cell wall biosynthesis